VKKKNSMPRNVKKKKEKKSTKRNCKKKGKDLRKKLPLDLTQTFIH
jgi:hypothetical protein